MRSHPGYVPISLASGAILFAFVVATVPPYRAFPWEAPGGWQNPLLVFTLGTCVALWLGALAARCVATTIRPLFGRPVRLWTGRTASDDALVQPAVSTLRHVAAASILALLVFVGTLSHVGDGSGFWRTSRPVSESDVVTADGYVFWLEERPLQSDSAHFVMGYAALFGEAALEGDPLGWLRAGRVAYTFLTRLAAGPAGMIGTTYGAFIAVNAVMWWGASMALYDLTRAARRSWWTGVAAGVLTATGLGFTFMVGAAMSPSAAYGAAALVPWVMWRLGALSIGTRMRDVVISGSLAGSAGLLNSLTPTFLLFALLWRGGVAEFRRLLLWSVIALAITVAWGRVLDVASLPTPTAQQVMVALTPAALILPALAIQLLPRVATEWLFAAGLSLSGFAAAALLVLTPSRVTLLMPQLLNELQIPDYVLGRATQLTKVFRARDLWAITNELRAGGFGEHLVAAFPSVLCPLAVVGLVGTRSSWIRWAGAVFVAAAVTTVGMNSLTGVPHPRLMYLAFPAVYLLAAGGLHTTWTTIVSLARPASRAPSRLTSNVALVAVTVLLCVAIAPSFAGLFGMALYDHRFHYLRVP